VRGEALDLIVTWLSDRGGQVAVYDTSNATVEQRRFVTDKIAQAFPPQNLVRIIWVECECDDAATIERNFLGATMKSPDFEGMSRQSALREFQKKTEHYKSTFVSLEESGRNERASFIKISDMGRRVVAHNAMGFLESKLVSFLTNIHLEPRAVLLARHGQTDYNIQNRVGGDSELTAAGKEFASNLAGLCARMEAAGWTGAEDPPQPPNAGQAVGGPSKLVLWTSIAKRAVQTGDPINCGSRVAWNGLNEIDAGVCEGLCFASPAAG
jgi:6-phosphofructo-2-kinase/fructose-2,6-biphosphatase 2